ncbi:hypothetical protein BU26DRAFT_450826 [Trematosphaeria pertusa]|uniref:Spindle pole body-associated protein cut12 domain-containing protein n=1 Tax=Trematosphaeria pertusa TaxID=390896 RepID=A0A6A6ITW2_9PLEO|nr:uncharacterized protein BU26DRAFT_450826 [Trematosphaeria pertusa]KAF2253799.1 hypothetical protein BU26DRAFT_450826 [Trematosphaeria pertusa]
MFSWITGPRITNVIEDLQAEPGYENTFVEPPDTPAHQFAVKAFRHALFGTPAPEDTNNPGKKLQKKQSPGVTNAKVPEIAAPKENAAPLSPSKQPGGILMTPGTANKGRKTVSFGVHVVDNEGKRGITSKSGIPNDCAGKFPSPWTPGTELKADGAGEKPRTKLTAALLDARATSQPKSGQKPKARDDSDITIDLGAPRSESGKYWKEQYESYAERSEKEMKKLVAKQQLAKNYAKKKDGEMTEVATRLEQERKRFRQRERELEQQNKDYQERLRQAMAEKFAASVEITALKNRIEILEKSMIVPSSEVQESKPSFQIYEDSSKDAVNLRSRQEEGPEESYLSRTARIPPVGKENSPPKPRHVRRQTLADAPSRPSTSHAATPRLGVDGNQASVILAKSPRVPASAANPTLAPPSTGTVSKSPISVRRPDFSKENLPPKSPAAVAASSPLPQPSPDPWIEANDSSLPQVDKMALPISNGQAYSRPSRPSQPSRHRVSKSMSYPTGSHGPGTGRRAEKRVAADNKPEARQTFTGAVEEPAQRAAKTASTQAAPEATEKTPTREIKLDAPTRESKQSSMDPKFDIAKITSHHAEGSSQVKRERVQLLPVDRKEEARRRLMERKQRKLLAG